MTMRAKRRYPSKAAPSRREMRKESINDRIVSAALQCVVSAGAMKLALAEVAQEAAISRTTLYKYYRSRDELLLAVSKRVRKIYKNELHAAIRGHDSPRERLLAVLEFIGDFHEKWHAEQMINLQIEQIVGTIRHDFSYYYSLLNKALTPVFASLERAGLQRKGRKMLVETLIRNQLSNAIVRLDGDWAALPKLVAAAWDVLSINFQRV